MTRLQQRLAGLIVLTIVSAVSLLAGGIILGGASADDGDAKPGTATPAPASFTTAIGLPDGAVAGCVIAFNRAPEGTAEPPTLMTAPAFGAISVQGGTPGEVVKSFRIVTADGNVLTGDDIPEGVFTQALEAKPISPEEIEKLKASGVFSAVPPADCNVINEDGSVTLPDGTVITPDANGELKLPDGSVLKAGKPGSKPFTIELKAP